MGTRNLTMVYLDGDYKVAQYGQWDGYPKGVGTTVLEFLREKMERDRFLANVRACYEVDPNEVEKRYAQLGADDSGFVSLDISNAFQKKWPQLDRDMGGNILEYIQSHDGGIELHRDIMFAGHSLFCEWAYVVDFDHGVFEVYRGFNKQPLDPDERFYGVACDNAGYRQIKLKHFWPLNALPTTREFLDAFKNGDAS